ncbi:MAG TPA: choice-of-anchor Q domain-containing protein [Actinomycetota bacterium]
MRARAVAIAGIAVLVCGLQASPGVAAATLTVDTFEDSFDGSCSDGDCSLRDAIASVDLDGTVRVPSGFYGLSLAGPGGIAEGDLDVERRMRIAVEGETGAFLDGSALGDRAFDLTAGATIERLTLLGGSGVDRGGLVRVGNGTTRLDDVTLLGGSAVDGGAVAVDQGASVVISRSWISAGTAADRGGGLFVDGSATVIRSTLSDGAARVGGGAWVSQAGSLVLLDSTVSSNTAEARGGGLHVRGEATVRSATVARNRATVAGGLSAADGASVAVGSSVFDRNQADRRRTCAGPVTSSGHNVADGSGCGLQGPGDRTGVDPRIGALRQNGGPTPTHALRSGSPAIGNGGTCSALDQRGAPRSDCDSGAYELVRCLGRPVTIVGTAGPDDLSGGLDRDVFLGRGGADVFQGSLAADRACGGAGHDRLIGGPGDDRLAGNSGDDALRGEDGDDVLVGGGGDDVCIGGDGFDVRRGC